MCSWMKNLVVIGKTLQLRWKTNGWVIVEMFPEKLCSWKWMLTWHALLLEKMY